MQKRHYVLKDNTLFMYHDDKSSIPSAILFMRGLHIVDKGWSDKEQMYHLCIKGIDSSKKQSKHFYHPIRKVLSSWITKLQKAAEDFSFSDKYFKGKQLG